VGAELKQQIIDYLDAHDRGVLATAKDGVPRASSVLYANERLTLYVHTIRGMAKVYNAEANPNVSLAIDDQAHEGWSKMKTLQYVGRAEVVTDPSEQQRGIDLYVGCFPMVRNMLTLAGLAKDQVLFKITPTKLIFSDYTQGMGYKAKLTEF
jgi:nitroimidazol reductase NimA-like FMN-containing flavoprotein (pyridoxamine 5'-phosphate oxidase superfamily)